jgi:hypothetical protein
MVTVLQVFCAVDFQIVFGSYDREAAVPSERPRREARRAEVHAGSAGSCRCLFGLMA